jgi:hypothetical protein
VLTTGKDTEEKLPRADLTSLSKTNGFILFNCIITLVSQYSHEKYWSEEAQLAVKREIATLLNNKNLILITGAGFSKNFGYPLWKEFLDKVNEECGAHINENDYTEDGILDSLRFAQAIRDKSPKNDFNDCITNCFDQSKCKKPINDFYEILIKLGFRGFATLNYDYTLEIIIEQVKKVDSPRISSIDFCGTDREFKVKKFLNNISEKKDEYCYILHLHGIYDTPSNIIFTQDSYEKWYENGPITKLLESVKTLKNDLKKKLKNDSYGEISELEKQIENIFQSNVLQSLHKKIIWSIFACYHLFFIGFSTEDIFFMKLLNVVINDLTLPSRPEHYILANYTPTENDDEKKEKDEICNKLINKGVFPIFYPVIDMDYENGLSKFIYEMDNLKTQVRDNRKKSQNVNEEKLQKTRLDKSIAEITAYTQRLK